LEDGTHTVELIDLSVQSFRNLSDAEFRFGKATNVVLGANGAGKTSLLEALVVLGNLRSFRTNSLRRAVRHGENTFRLTGTVSVGDNTHRLEQVVEVGPPVSRTLRVDGASVDVEQYLQFLPVFAICGHDRELVGGGPDGRRALLDRFVFLLRPAYIEDLRAYRRTLRQRNAALVAGSTDFEIDAWETPLAAAAARVVVARQEGASVLEGHFSDVWNELSNGDSPQITLEYRPEPWCGPSQGVEKVEDLYRQRYNETRTRDRQMGFTVDGPHRHDLSLKTDGRSVRYVLSSGQTKRVAAALRLATLAEVEKERNEHFPVIVDDVDAELDGAALTLLVQRLGNERQLFLSSTSERVAELGGPCGHPTWLENGTCVSQEAASDD
jgi:DNA replication and repair protein RecF